MIYMNSLHHYVQLIYLNLLYLKNHLLLFILNIMNSSMELKYYMLSLHVLIIMFSLELLVVLLNRIHFYFLFIH